MNRNITTLMTVSVVALLGLAIVSVVGFQDAAADGDKIWKFFKKFTKKADFVAKMDTAQIPDVHRTFDDRGKTGMAKFNFDGDLSKLEYSIVVEGLDLKGLSNADPLDDLTKIHFHESPPNTPGPHVLNVLGAPCEPDKEMSFFSYTGVTTGAWDDNDDLVEDEICGLADGPASESLTEKLEALCNGDLYVNIHTSYAIPANSDAVGDNGEIRGQILPTKQGKKICEDLLG